MESGVITNTKVEITVRNPKGIDFELPELLTKYLDGEKPGKKIFLLPLDWEGFMNGFFNKLRESGLDIYAAIAYTPSGNEEVLGLDRKPARPFVHRTPKGIVKKFVKVALIIGYPELEVSIFLRVNKPLPVEFVVRRK